MSQPIVSFVVPVYNETTELTECLNSILALDYPKECIDVVVVGVVPKEIIDDYPAVRFIIRECTQPVARNIGIKESKGEYVFDFNAHAVVKDENFITTVLSKFTIYVDAVGYTVDSAVSSTTDEVIVKILESPFAGAGSNIFMQNKQKSRDCFVDHTPFVCYRKGVLDALGGYDEAFVSGADAELNYRLKCAGMKLFFTNDTKVFLRKPATLKSLFSKMFTYGTARGNIIRKHKESNNLVYTIPLVGLLGVVCLVLFAFFISAVIDVLLLGILFYLCLSMIFSYKAVGFDDIPAGAIIFPIIHVGYTLGLINGRWFKKYEL